MDITALFCQRDSIYKKLENVDVFDIDRDATTWIGGTPVIAHPPCRSWGRLRAFAKPRQGEKELAIWSINQIRRWGGVLEHPIGSKLWSYMDIPISSKPDKFGGYTLSVDQFWFGHKAQKRTWLYVCGTPLKKVPPIPLIFGVPTHTISSSRARFKNGKKEVSKWEREATPLDFALFLIEIARSSRPNSNYVAPSYLDLVTGLKGSIALQ